MNRRHKIQVGALLVGPVACGIAFYLLFRDSYLSMVLANLLLFIILRFLDLEAFLFVENLQNLWREQRRATKKLVFDPATCVTVGNAVVVEATLEVLLGEENLAKLGRLKSLLGETGVFIYSRNTG